MFPLIMPNINTSNLSETSSSPSLSESILDAPNISDNNLSLSTKNENERQEELVAENFFNLLNAFLNPQEQPQTEQALTENPQAIKNTIGKAEENGNIKNVPILNLINKIKQQKEMLNLDTKMANQIQPSNINPNVNSNLNQDLHQNTNLNREILNLLNEFNTQKNEKNNTLDFNQNSVLLNNNNQLPFGNVTINNDTNPEKSKLIQPLPFQELKTEQLQIKEFIYDNNNPIIQNTIPDEKNTEKLNELIVEIKKLPASEQVKVAQFLLRSNNEQNIKAHETQFPSPVQTQEQTKAIQPLLAEKTEFLMTTNIPTNPEMKLNEQFQKKLSKEVENILTEIKNQPKAEQTKILQTLLAPKTDNPLIIPSVLANDMQEKRNDDEHTESTFIHTNNGETWTHSDIVKTDINNTTTTAEPKKIDHVVSKVIELSDQLKAAQGGVAKLQIQDPHLGKIDLQIDMKHNNAINVSIQAEHEHVKKHIEDKVDSLKQSLDSQKINLTDFKVTLVDKPNNISSQLNQENQNNQNALSYTQQNAYLQNNSNQKSNNEHNDNNGNQAEGNKNRNYKNVQKNSITNIQRGANGSIKVLA